MKWYVGQVLYYDKDHPWRGVVTEVVDGKPRITCTIDSENAHIKADIGINDCYFPLKSKSLSRVFE